MTVATDEVGLADSERILEFYDRASEQISIQASTQARKHASKHARKQGSESMHSDPSRFGSVKSRP